MNRMQCTPVDFIFVEVANLQMELGYATFLYPEPVLHTHCQQSMARVEGNENGSEQEQNGSFQKRSTLPPQRKFLPSGGGGETKLFLIIVNVLGHP